MKEPKDLKIKIGTKEEAYWKEVQEKTEHEIDALERMLKLNKAIWDMCQTKIVEEVERRDNKNGNR